MGSRNLPRLSDTDTLKYVAATLALVTGLIHLYVMPDHWAEFWGFGVFFLGVGVLQILGGLRLLGRPSLVVYDLWILGLLTVFAIYICTRTMGVPFGPHAGEREPIGSVDLASKAAEAALIGSVMYLRTRYLAATQLKDSARGA